MKSELLRRPHKFWSQGQKLNFWMMDAGLGGVGEVNLSNILCLGHLPTAIIKHVLPNFQLSSQTLAAANFSVPRQSTLILVWDVARVWTGWLQHLEGKCSRKPEAWQVVGERSWKEQGSETGGAGAPIWRGVCSFGGSREGKSWIAKNVF